MAGDRGISFPVAGLAVVALFLSTLFLAPRGYDFLRQSENDAGKQIQLSQPSVEARLWEDPLDALRRHRDRLAEQCKAADAGAGGAAQLCREGQPADAASFRKKFKDDSLVVIAAMLPGASFVGSEEVRRRSRYALLTGLDAAGYVPDNSERMSLLRVPRCDSFSTCKSEPASNGNTGSTQIALADAATQVAAASAVATSPAPIELVYETLSTASAGDAAEKRRRAVVLWLDDSLLGRSWLITLSVLLKELAPDKGDVRLRILGPASSEGLVSALDDLTELAAKARTDEGRTDAFRENWNVLARLRLISPNATAADRELVMAAKPFTGRSAKAMPGTGAAACSPGVLPVEEAFRQRLEDIHGTLGAAAEAAHQEKPPGPRMFFFRTIGTDDRLIDRLVDELFGRGLDARAAGVSRRVALIGEWDSIYARTFADSLQAKLLCKGKEKGLKIDLLSYQYLRGLDGVTVQGAPAPNLRGGDNLRVSGSPLGSSVRSGDRNAPPVEWAEGRNQRDYLRRLVDLRLGQNDWRHPETEIQAIGIIGSDVHDKLMIAQALRGTFQDRVIFTTDLDARLLHPVVNQYTRNLVVASSLPLALADDLQCGVPPFRDSYQAAMFLAGRYAVTAMRAAGEDGRPGSGCARLNATDLERRIRAAITNPYLFEVSRDGVVELAAANEAPRTTPARREGEARVTYAILAGTVLVMLGLVMVLGMPGPAMQAAMGSWSSAAAAGQQAHAGRSTIVIALLQAAALGFAAGVVIELGAPGSVGPFGAILLGVAAGAAFWAFLWPGTRWVRSVSPGGPSGRRWELLTFQILVFLAAVIALWVVVVAPQTAVTDIHEPFAAFSGASAWPSQLLRTLSIVLFAWFLDHAWCRTGREADIIEAAYFPGQPQAPPAVAGSWLLRALVACRNATIWMWQPRVLAEPDGAIDGAGLWREYRQGLLGWPRLGRVAMWLAFTIGAMVLVGCLVGGARPEIPARGIADRMLFQITLAISVLALLCLLVVVADATVLTWRFIVLLKRGRTRYPKPVVERFAAELGGTDLQALAARRIAARPTERGGTVGRNTLLDDWIEARLLGEQTAAIGPLIIFPFILVTLMIVARSRLFDNWQVSASIMIVFAGLVLWSLAMAFLLNYGAEMARRVAIERMQADLLWLKGAGPDYAPLAQQFPGLIDQVRNLRQGAFAPFFEQPLVKALLVPLGGAGGVQLLDLVLFGS